ncbi:collagen alpha-1(I) chain-like [Bubalus bubalis]|uniref:collagen alpha-1(I) chain-like n=1 Tax=Bubalus bubalis TaxID=89462 RepID=UPI000DBCA392|nr:collagen alpha-1(I) chain-like [Bubalus bubalis]
MERARGGRERVFLPAFTARVGDTRRSDRSACPKRRQNEDWRRRPTLLPGAYRLLLRGGSGRENVRGFRSDPLVSLCSGPPAPRHLPGRELAGARRCGQPGPSYPPPPCVPGSSGAGRGRGGARALAPAPPSPLRTRHASRPQGPAEAAGRARKKNAVIRALGGGPRGPASARREPSQTPFPGGRGEESCVMGTPHSHPWSRAQGCPLRLGSRPESQPPSCLRLGLILRDALPTATEKSEAYLERKFWQRRRESPCAVSGVEYRKPHPGPAFQKWPREGTTWRP